MKKIPMTHLGIEPMTWFVAQCLNQLRHRFPHIIIIIIIIININFLKTKIGSNV
jgi:hypothetical protein